MFKIYNQKLFVFDSSKAASKAIDDFQSYKKALEKGEESK